MEKDRQIVGSVVEVAGDKTTQKPEPTIQAEISVEVTGKDEPTKYDKRRGRWAVVVLLSLVTLVLSSVLFFLLDMNIYMFGVAAVSCIVLGISFTGATTFGDDEPTGHTPWWYGAA